MERIWDGLLDSGFEPDSGLTGAQKAEIDRRIDEDDEFPDDIVSRWAVKADLVRQYDRPTDPVAEDDWDALR